MKELINNTVMLIIALCVIFTVIHITKDDISTDTTIKKYIDKEANMMCYYTDTWGSCFYVLED